MNMAGAPATIDAANSRVLETAAAHASNRVPIAEAGDRVGAVLAGMQGQRFDTASMVAVCDGGRLVGLATLEELLAAPPGAGIADVMDPDPPVVAPGVDQERAAWTAVHQDEATLAVVDEDGRFVGLIPPRRLLEVLLAEHDEDLARFGGFLGTAASARKASEENVARRLWHRLPWLLLGLVGALLAAGVVGAFEETLERNVLLAFFVPGVVYLADAVGTQTETLVIRGLSVGVSIGKIVGRELVTGALIGVLLAVVVLPIIVWLWGDAQVAAAVSVALFAACSIATTIAMALPWLLNRLGRDPAYASGPIATVVQDLLSIAIYFAAAEAILAA
jgi:magnesium transporter